MLSLTTGTRFYHVQMSQAPSQLPYNNDSVSAKIVLLGESTVGKSSLVLRFVMGQFLENQKPTIGTAYSVQSVCTDDRMVRFKIWDTAGQERYHSLAPIYYRRADAAIIVYDITNKESFSRAKNWVKVLQNYASTNIVIALAGNKVDLASQRLVELDEAQTYADDNALLFMETSAKTAMNVNDIFLAIAKQLPRSDVGGAGGQEIERVDLQTARDKPQGSSCCSKSS